MKNMNVEAIGTNQSSVKYSAEDPPLAHRRCARTSIRSVRKARRMTLATRGESACRNGERKRAHSGSAEATPAAVASPSRPAGINQSGRRIAVKYQEKTLK